VYSSALNEVTYLRLPAKYSGGLRDNMFDIRCGITDQFMLQATD